MVSNGHHSPGTAQQLAASCRGAWQQQSQQSTLCGRCSCQLRSAPCCQLLCCHHSAGCQGMGRQRPPKPWHCTAAGKALQRSMTMTGSTEAHSVGAAAASSALHPAASCSAATTAQAAKDLARKPSKPWHCPAAGKALQRSMATTRFIEPHSVDAAAASSALHPAASCFTASVRVAALAAKELTTKGTAKLKHRTAASSRVQPTNNTAYRDELYRR